MRVKLKDAPMISIDKAQGKEIMAQMYAFGSEQAVNFMKNISTLVNMY